MESIAMKCNFCSKEYTSKIGLGNHVRRCPKNPERKHEGLTPEGRERIRQHRIKQNLVQWADPEFRQLHRDSMRRAVENHPESYTTSNRGRTKQIIYDGIKFQGQLELDFYKWAKDQGFDPKRPDRAFRYFWNGERWYHPDFYIEKLATYIEVKGYETDRDRAKWKQFPEKLIIIKEQQIKQIRNGSFLGIDL